MLALHIHGDVEKMNGLGSTESSKKQSGRMASWQRATACVCETGHMHARASHAERSASWAYQGGAPLRTVNGIFFQPQLLDLGFLEGALASGLPRSYITDETLQELVVRQRDRQRLVVCKVSVAVLQRYSGSTCEASAQMQ